MYAEGRVCVHGTKGQQSTQDTKHTGLQEQTNTSHPVPPTPHTAAPRPEKAAPPKRRWRLDCTPRKKKKNTSHTAPRIARTSATCCSADFIDTVARGAATRAAARSGCTKAPSRRPTAAVDVAARVAVGLSDAAAAVTNAMVGGGGVVRSGGGGGGGSTSRAMHRGDSRSVDGCGGDCGKRRLRGRSRSTRRQ